MKGGGIFNQSLITAPLGRDYFGEVWDQFGDETDYFGVVMDYFGGCTFYG